MISRQLRVPGHAILFCVLALGARPLLAQQPPSQPLKSGTTATVLALLLPGAGHIYAGETGRGLLLMGTGALAWGYAFSDGQCKRPYTDVRTCELEKNETLAGISMAAALGVYAFSAWDAHRAVKRTNARRTRVVGYFSVAAALAASPVPRPTGFLKIELSQRP